MYSNGIQLNLKSISAYVKPMIGFVIYEDPNLCLDEISLAGPMHMPGTTANGYLKMIKAIDHNYICCANNNIVKKNKNLKQLSKIPFNYNIIKTGLW